MNAFLLQLPMLLLILVLYGSVRVWLEAIRKRKSGQRIWDYQPRMPVPWGLIDVMVVGMVLLLVPGIGMIAAQSLGWISKGLSSDSTPDQQAAALFVSSIATLIALPVGLFVLRTRSGADRTDIGVSPVDWSSDFADGLKMFLLLAVPVLSLQLILVQFFPPSHPIIDLLKENPSVDFFFASLLTAVIAAPIVEEVIFRMLIQGWLESLALQRQTAAADGSNTRITGLQFLLGLRFTPPEAAMIASLSGDTHSTEEASNPLAPQAPTSDLEPVDHPNDSQTVTIRPARWPIFVTSALFALAHFGHSSDPIPLFLFALGLGYLYRQTHRLWPCIVVHMLLNSFSMVQLAILLFHPDAAEALGQ